MGEWAVKKIIEILIIIAVGLLMTRIAGATTVTATLQDPTGQILSNSSVHIEFLPAPNTNNNPIIQPIDLITNSIGFFSTTLTANTSITPSGSTYIFTICPNASMPCSIIRQIQISGTTQDISNQLNAGIAQVAVNPQTILSKAYTDSELNVTGLSREGALYWNTTNRYLGLWDGAGWNNFTPLVNRDVRIFGVKCDGVTDDIVALEAARDSLPQYAGLTTASGKPQRTGRLIFPGGTCIISRTFLISTGIELEGAGGQFNTWIKFKANSVTNPASEQFLVAYDPAAVGSWASSFDATIRNISFDCNQNFNAGSSGLLWGGAQLSRLSQVYIQNCALRGLYHTESGHSSIQQVWIFNIARGPGFDAQNCRTTSWDDLSVEQVNSAGTNLDTDGDPQAALRLDHCRNVNITDFQSEKSYLPLKVLTSYGIKINGLSMSPQTNLLPQAVIIAGDVQNINLKDMLSYQPVGLLFTNWVLDRRFGAGAVYPVEQIQNPTASYPPDNGAGFVWWCGNQATCTAPVYGCYREAAGFVQLSGGTRLITLPITFKTTTDYTCWFGTNANQVTFSRSTVNTMTITGTGTDTIGWRCGGLVTTANCK